MRLPQVVCWPDGSRAYVSEDDATADALRALFVFLTGRGASRNYQIVPASTFAGRYASARKAALEAGMAEWRKTHAETL